MPDEAIFYGSIHPSGEGWTFERPFRIEYADGGTAEVLVHYGRFQARLTMVFIEDIQGFINQLQVEIQGLLDSLGFHLGLAITAELEGGFIAPNKAVVVARHLWPEAVGRTWEDPLLVDAETLEPFTRAAIEEPLVRVALGDIRTAIGQPADTGFHAYRAVESARQWFQGVEPATDDRDEGWRRLRSDLGIDARDLVGLAGLAHARRHGETVTITEDERLWAIDLARRVVGGLVSRVVRS